MLSEGDDTETVVREVFTVHRDALAPENLGLQLAEAKDLLAVVQHTMVTHQVATALAAQIACPDCGTPRAAQGQSADRDEDAVGTLPLDSPPLGGNARAHRSRSGRSAH